MGISATTYVLSKKYTEETAIGLGAVKGAPAEVKNTIKSNGITYVTLEWTASDGTKKTQTLEVADGATPELDPLDNTWIIAGVDTNVKAEATLDDIELSTELGNILEKKADGLYVGSSGVEISAKTDNSIETKTDGLYVNVPIKEVQIDSTTVVPDVDGVVNIELTDTYIPQEDIEVETLKKLSTVTENVDGVDKEYLLFNGDKIETDLSEYYTKDETDELFLVTLPPFYKKVLPLTPGSLKVVDSGGDNITTIDKAILGDNFYADDYVILVTDEKVEKYLLRSEAIELPDDLLKVDSIITTLDKDSTNEQLLGASSLYHLLYKEVTTYSFVVSDASNPNAKLIVSNSSIPSVNEITESDAKALLGESDDLVVGTYIEISTTVDSEPIYASTEEVQESLDQSTFVGTRETLEQAIIDGNIRDGALVIITDETPTEKELDLTEYLKKESIVQTLALVDENSVLSTKGVDSILYTVVPAHYAKSESGLEVVATAINVLDPDNQIAISDVTPCADIIQVGDYVVFIPESKKENYLKATDFDIETVLKLSTITETDFDGNKKEYLAFNGSKIETEIEFETEKIDFNSLEYQSLLPTDF